MRQGIKKLVARLELCKKIGNDFNDTLYAWVIKETVEGTVEEVVLRSESFPLNHGRVVYPAPTLNEILCEMAKYPHTFNNLTCDPYGEKDFGVTAFVPYRGKPGSRLTECRAEYGADAALSLFLILGDKTRE